MFFESSIASLFESVGKAATEAFQFLTHQISGPPSTLRDGTEHHGVTLPRDLAAHGDVQTEWWYYTGHGETRSGRQFGFELVFFKRRTDLDQFSVVPLRLIGNPFYFAHFAVTDHKTGRFRYSHRKSANGLIDMPASASETHYHVRLGDWSAREAHNMHILRASLDGGSLIEASLKPLKPVILNGPDGVSFKDEGEASRYFSYSRMAVEGDLTLDGLTEHFKGTAWMDREFGTWTPTENQKGWDWFSIQLEENCELMCYQLRNGEGKASPFSSGTFVNADGSYLPLDHSEFSIEVLDRWTSPNTRAEYPIRWKIAVPSLGLELEVEPVVKNQELDTRGTTMIVYWEGSCVVKGKRFDESVSGRGYVELVGYDRSHERPNLATFLTGTSFDIPGFAVRP